MADPSAGRARRAATWGKAVDAHAALGRASRTHTANVANVAGAGDIAAAESLAGAIVDPARGFEDRVKAAFGLLEEGIAILEAEAIAAR